MLSSPVSGDHSWSITFMHGPFEILNILQPPMLYVFNQMSTLIFLIFQFLKKFAVVKILIFPNSSLFTNLLQSTFQYGSMHMIQLGLNKTIITSEEGIYKDNNFELIEYIRSKDVLALNIRRRLLKSSVMLTPLLLPRYVVNSPSTQEAQAGSGRI